MHAEADSTARVSHPVGVPVVVPVAVGEAAGLNATDHDLNTHPFARPGAQPTTREVVAGDPHVGAFITGVAAALSVFNAADVVVALLVLTSTHTC